VSALEAVEVRRHTRLVAAVGLLATAVSVAYLRRGLISLEGWDLVVAGIFAIMAIGYLASWLDARTPLLVLDEAGVRFRLGRTWRALTWAETELVDVVPRDRWWRDGRLRVIPASSTRQDPTMEEGALGDLSWPARGQAWLNRRCYGADIAVPLGLATQVRPADADLVELVAAWADQKPTEPAPSDAQPGDAHLSQGALEVTPAARARWRDPRPALAAGIGMVAAGLRLPARATTDRPNVATTPPARPDDTQPVPIVIGALALSVDEADATSLALPEVAELRRPDGSDELDPLGPDDPPVSRPRPIPVIGPTLVTARTRLGLGIDQVAERTRIRPHVIAAIDGDDFGPCGGDFYARGHLRTLARVLGIEAPPLVEAYDELYADAPAGSHRIVEAELAPPGLPSLRSSRGGPNWSLLVAVVMGLVLVWSVIQLVVGGPAPREPLPGLSQGSGGVGSSGVGDAAAVPVLLTAAGGGAHVIVRDGEGRIVFTGDLAYGASRSLRAAPPIRVDSSDGSLEVVIAGEDHGALGDTGRPAAESFVG
jgi:Helix-turn-helix domain